MRWGSWNDIDWNRLEKTAFWIVAALLAFAAVTWIAIALASPAEAYELALPGPEAEEVEVLPIPSSPPRSSGVEVLAVTETPTPKMTPKPPAVPNGSVWDALADCESGGDWAANTGNGYHGGVQFLNSTWVSAGGTKYAGMACQATREQQIEIAQGWLAQTSWAQWPVCSRRLGLR